MVRIPCACHVKRNPSNDTRLPTFWQRPQTTAPATIFTKCPIPCTCHVKSRFDPPKPSDFLHLSCKTTFCFKIPRQPFRATLSTQTELCASLRSRKPRLRKDTSKDTTPFTYRKNPIVWTHCLGKKKNIYNIYLYIIYFYILLYIFSIFFYI